MYNILSKTKMFVPIHHLIIIIFLLNLFHQNHGKQFVITFNEFILCKEDIPKLNGKVFISKPSVLFKNQNHNKQ